MGALAAIFYAATEIQLKLKLTPVVPLAWL